MSQTESTNSIDKHVGSRVRMRRLMLKMSQTKLGDALGLTFQQVQRYEKGMSRIGASRLQHLSQILQVPVEFFFEELLASRGSKNAAAPPSPVIEFMTTSEGLALAKAFMKIPDTQMRRRVADLVEEIVGGTLH